MKQMMKVLCLICAAVLLSLIMAGCGGGPDIISDAEEVVSMVMDIAEDIADPAPPVVEDTPEPEQTPAATDEPQSALEGPAQTPSAEIGGAATTEPNDALRPGEYVGSDGSVLNVNEDGTCTYETVIPDAINGEDMTGTVTFHGTVADGEISFTKITYFGLDITALFAAAGYSDLTDWETTAQTIYNG